MKDNIKSVELDFLVMQLINMNRFDGVLSVNNVIPYFGEPAKNIHLTYNCFMHIFDGNEIKIEPHTEEHECLYSIRDGVKVFTLRAKENDTEKT